jgi:hypothetical protein
MPFKISKANLLDVVAAFQLEVWEQPSCVTIPVVSGGSQRVNVGCILHTIHSSTQLDSL